jgi:hypothetical protein
MTMPMPDKLIPVLSAACAALTALYVVLVITTIFLASWQSQSMSDVRNTESAIGNLEAQYYTTINQINTMDPHSLGFVSPSDIEYVAATHLNAGNLTFAGN